MWVLALLSEFHLNVSGFIESVFLKISYSILSKLVRSKTSSLGKERFMARE